MADYTALPRQKHKHVWIAIALQCVPLLSLAAVALAGWELLWGALLFWGLGYKYLGKTGRRVGVGLFGPVFSLLSLATGVALSFEQPAHIWRSNFTTVFIVIICAVVVLAVDAWRLAMVHNDALDTAASQGREMPA